MFTNALREKKLLKVVSILLVFMTFFYMDIASAGATISDFGTNVDNTSKILAKTAKIVAALIGFILVLTGVNGIVQAKKQQQSMGLPLTLVLVGAALLSSVVISSIGTSAMFAGESNGLSDLGL